MQADQSLDTPNKHHGGGVFDGVSALKSLTSRNAICGAFQSPLKHNSKVLCYVIFLENVVVISPAVSASSQRDCCVSAAVASLLRWPSRPPIQATMPSSTAALYASALSKGASLDKACTCNTED